MRLADLEDLIRAQLLATETLGLRGNMPLRVRSILNYGGFVNRSFKATGGGHAYHVKLSADAYSLRGLEGWRALATTLRDDYLAPAMRAWIDVPGTPFAGPVFDWIEGTPPAAVDAATRQTMVAAISRLHRDRSVAAHLGRMGDIAASCAEAYHSTYHDRFVEDLEAIRVQPPPFVTLDFVDWMSAEANAMARRVAASAAFAAPAAAATHRDLWLDNLLVTSAGSLYILDWDEMGLGDPMMDWAMLFGPSRANVRPAADGDLGDLPVTADERARFAVYARASLLDWIIDPLADWVEAAGEPEHGGAVRESNRRVHGEALSLYRRYYGS